MSIGRYTQVHNVLKTPIRRQYLTLCTPLADFQGAFAALFQAVSDTNAQWWSIKIIDDEIPSLANFAQLKQHDLEQIMQYAAFGTMRGDKFLFFRNKFKTFRATHELEDGTELNQQKPTGCKIHNYFYN